METNEEEDMFGDDFDLEELNDLYVGLNKEQKKQADTFDDLPLEDLLEILDAPKDNVDSSLAADTTPSEPLSGPTIVASNGESQPKYEHSTQDQGEIGTAKKKRRFTRYLVANVTIGTFHKKEQKSTEKVLLLLQEDKDVAITARLRDEWLQTVVNIGDVVHIPYTKETVEIIIDQERNFIIVHPDRLISCTAVAGSNECSRRSYFQDRVRSVSDFNEPLVHGNILHRVVQSVLQTGNFSIDSIKAEIELAIQGSIEELYAIDKDEESTMSILSEYAETIHKLGSLYVGSIPKPKAHTSSNMGKDAAKIMNFKTVAISKVLDIEEHIWSPTYGLKGMIDASVQLKMSPTGQVLTVPFELKTGKASGFLEHRAQTVLYTLLMSDRYDVDITAGILYYTKTNSFYVLPALRNELVSMVILRNALACSLKDKKKIPPMLRDFRTCQYCYSIDACTVYHKIMEDGTGTTSGLSSLFDKKTKRITGRSALFFKKWWGLLEKEKIDYDYLLKGIWSQNAAEKSLTGTCLGSLKLDMEHSNIDPNTGRWNYRFIASEEDKPLYNSFSPSDLVIVSSMEGHVYLSCGVVLFPCTKYIQVSLNEPLRNPPIKSDKFDKDNNQDFIPFFQHNGDVNQLYQRNNIQYRIDLDDGTDKMGVLRNNLIELAKGNERKKELIVNLEKPIFDGTIQPKEPISLHLNTDQRNVLTKVLQAKDYKLILGMPGTGKTTTTAEIIKYLVGMGKTVLVAAFTHNALDNVLCKVKAQGIDLVRIGPSNRVMASLRDCDLYQLPPLVQDSEALHEGMQKSLFAILAEAHPESVSLLEHQYRMNKEIMEVANMLVYDGKLKCGKYSVSTQSLVLPRLEDGLKNYHMLEGTQCQHPQGNCWLYKVLDPE
ncbi:DNA replication factor Dna2-domain-containing protein [Sporodiniella umbellata]|nr:DNA replication factor Dna2-domain-containing protein [Sporodiniella umbellata]